MKISAKTASPIVIWAKNASSQLLELQLLEFLHLLGSGKFWFLKKRFRGIFWWGKSGREILEIHVLFLGRHFGCRPLDPILDIWSNFVKKKKKRKKAFYLLLYNCSTKLPFKFSRSFIDEIIHHKNFFIWPSAAKCKPKPKCVYFNFFTFISSDF